MMSTGTMSKPNVTETETWLVTELHCNSLTRQADSEPVNNRILWSTYPFLNEYYSPLNPIYTPFFKSLCDRGLASSTDRQLPIWMIRDGLIPLTWYLRERDPASVQGRLLVHESLSRFVTKGWQEKVLLYRFCNQGQRPLKSLLIAGLVDERMMSLSELELRLKEITQLMRDLKFDKKDITLFCPVFSWQERLAGEYFKRIFSYFPKAKLESWSTLANRNSFIGTGYIELNSGWLIRDTFVQQHVLNRGASLFASATSRKGQFVALSPFHGVEFWPFPRNQKIEELDRTTEEFYKQMFAIDEQSTIETLWPLWHEKRCRACYKLG